MARLLTWALGRVAFSQVIVESYIADPITPARNIKFFNNSKYNRKVRLGRRRRIRNKRGRSTENHPGISFLEFGLMFDL